MTAWPNVTLAPLLTDMAPPRLLVSPVNPSVPAFTAVVPPYVLLPASVIVPVPAFVRPPVPEMTPEKPVSVLLPPAVSVPEPSVTLPAPASEPTAWLKLLRSRVWPAATVWALLEENALTAPALSVPSLIAVAPA